MSCLEQREPVSLVVDRQMLVRSNRPKRCQKSTPFRSLGIGQLLYYLITTGSHSHTYCVHCSPGVLKWLLFFGAILHVYCMHINP